jgi:uncharacterized membrane protein
MTHAAPAEVPSRNDPTVWRASRLIGGPWGRYAVASSWWTPLRALLLLASFTLLLGYFQKAPCADGNWTANKQYTHVCYSDVIPLWGAERLDVGAVPYRDNAVEYPVLTGGFMWATAGITRGVQAIFDAPNAGVVFAVITCIGLAVCGLLAVAGTVGAAGRRPYDAAIFALSPLLVFHAYSNWDLLAIALASCALWAWAREKPVAAGVLLGLGTAAKLYPIFLLLPIAILAFRTARYRAAVWCAGTASFRSRAATWLSTVRTETWRRSAISRLRSRSASAQRTSASRSVTPARASRSGMTSPSPVIHALCFAIGAQRYGSGIRTKIRAPHG